MISWIYDWIITLDGITDNLLFKMTAHIYNWVWNILGKWFWQASLMGSQDNAFDFRCKELVVERVAELKYV